MCHGWAANIYGCQFFITELKLGAHGGILSVTFHFFFFYNGWWVVAMIKMKEEQVRNIQNGNSRNGWYVASFILARSPCPPDSSHPPHLVVGSTAGCAATNGCRSPPPPPP